MLGEVEIGFVYKKSGFKQITSHVLGLLLSFVQFMLCVAEAFLYILQRIKNQIISFVLTKETHQQILAVQRCFQYF